MDLIRPIIQYRLGFERVTVAKLITECGKLMTALFIKFLTKQQNKLMLLLLLKTNLCQMTASQN
jgi:hypothetical protein